MWIPVVAGLVVGLWGASSRQPHSKVKKRSLLGAKSGLVYECDEFPEVGMIVVHAPQLHAVASFAQSPQGLTLHQAKGLPEGVRRLCLDLGVAIPARSQAQAQAQPQPRGGWGQVPS